MDGEIFVSLKFVANKYELIIRDNGVGMSEKIDFNNLDTRGLLLVNNLTEQIDGEMTINREQSLKSDLKKLNIETGCKTKNN